MSERGKTGNLAGNFIPNVSRSELEINIGEKRKSSTDKDVQTQTAESFLSETNVSSKTSAAFEDIQCKKKIEMTDVAVPFELIGNA